MIFSFWNSIYSCFLTKGTVESRKLFSKSAVFFISIRNTVMVVFKISEKTGKKQTNVKSTFKINVFSTHHEIVRLYKNWQWLSKHPVSKIRCSRQKKLVKRLDMQYCVWFCWHTFKECKMGVITHIPRTGVKSVHYDFGHVRVRK